ncbi:MAG: hypothetical protein D4R70_02410 [Betaproteobacteria bacterium]|nr:MAG: hypothetical protein D4R70_02410 [Betaproteobacteria bacterium]
MSRLLSVFLLTLVTSPVLGAAPMPPVNGTVAAPTGTVNASDSLKGKLATLQDYFTEEEWKQVSHYLLDAALDGLQGTEDASLAPDLAFRLEILQRRMRVEGDGYIKDLSQKWDAMMIPPPPVVYEPRPLPAWGAPSAPVNTPPAPPR